MDSLDDEDSASPNIAKLLMKDKLWKFFKYAWNLCWVAGKKIVIALIHLIFITLFCTLPHELGHATAASYFSHKVNYITFGFIPSLSSDY